MELSDKVDKILELVTEVRIDQAKQAVVLQRNTDDLELHIKRTALAEERIEAMELPMRLLKYAVLGLISIATGVGAVYTTIQLFIR